MKRKKILSLTSLLLGAALFAGCTSTNYKIAFGDYWYYTVDAHPSETLEKLTYKIDFTSDAGWNNYTVSYTNGVYETTLTTDKETYGREVYKYETKLTIDVAYAYDGKTSETFTDTVTSTVYVEKVLLAPIRSVKNVISHSPVNGDMTDETVKNLGYDYTVDVDYVTKKRTVTNNKLEENAANRSKTIDVEIDEKDTEKYSLIDNEALLLALRAVNPSSSASHELLVYAPFSEETQKITASYASKEIAEGISFKKDGVVITEDIYYNAVTLSINSNNSGASQTVWVANASNVKANDYRNVILRYEAPVSYNLGTLVYTLESAQFAAKN
ncbi:MAG: hypothetical protein IJX91_05425 [Clostridia bacterium]|nr:hypothetical protein [Clostridia bacterium]